MVLDLWETSLLAHQFLTIRIPFNKWSKKWKFSKPSFLFPEQRYPLLPLTSIHLVTLSWKLSLLHYCYDLTASSISCLLITADLIMAYASPSRSTDHHLRSSTLLFHVSTVLLRVSAYHSSGFCLCQCYLFVTVYACVLVFIEPCTHSYFPQLIHSIYTFSLILSLSLCV